MRIIGVLLATISVTLGASAARGQETQGQSAEAFVRSLYGGTSWRSVLTAETARLQRSAAAAARDEVPDFLDGDPLCACQDDEGLRVLEVRVEPARRRLTQVRVRFDLAGPPGQPDRTVRLLLARSGQSWLIHDILFPAGSRTLSYRWALRHNGGR